MRNTVGRIMDRASQADREALFAALQAAVNRLIQSGMDRPIQAVDDDLDEIERRLQIGHPYGWEHTRGREQ